MEIPFTQRNVSLVGIFGGIRHQQRARRAADADVRYWGNRSSVTGAVGLLDRVAPQFFAAPVFFHSVRWTFAQA